MQTRDTSHVHTYYQYDLFLLLFLWRFTVLVISKTNNAFEPSDSPRFIPSRRVTRALG